jgi:hypothetical protein
MAIHITRLTLLVMCVCYSASCSNDTAAPLPTPDVVSANAESTRHPLVFTATATLSAPARVEARYYDAGRDTLVVSDSSASTSHTILLTRLHASSSYTVEVRSVNASGAYGSPRVSTFNTGPLPAGIGDDHFDVSGAPTLPLTVLQISAASNGWFGVVALDEAGQVVWYHRTVTGAMGFTRRSNGQVAIIDKGIVVIGPTGDTVAALPQSAGATYGTIHHGIANAPDGDLLFTATDTRVIDDTAVVGDAVWKWSPETGVLQKKWTAFDFLDWKSERTASSGKSDWLHANAVSMGSHGNVIVGFRNLDQVISIAPDWTSLEWRLGGPGATVTTPADATFSGQHGAHQLANGNVLMFDNGFDRPDHTTFSRGLELSIDASAHAARKVWEYRSSPDIIATRLGSAIRYSNGNTMLDFGWLDPSPIEIVEVDAAGVVRYRLNPTTATIGKIYGVETTSSLFGEHNR